MSNSFQSTEKQKYSKFDFKTIYLQYWSFIFRFDMFVALKVVKSAKHYTETAEDEIKLLKCVSWVNYCKVLVQAPRPNAGRRKKSRENYLFFWGGKKLPKKSFFFCIYLLVMPKYWGKQIFTHGRFPEVGEK